MLTIEHGSMPSEARCAVRPELRTQAVLGSERSWLSSSEPGSVLSGTRYRSTNLDRYCDITSHQFVSNLIQSESESDWIQSDIMTFDQIRSNIIMRFQITRLHLITSNKCGQLRGLKPPPSGSRPSPATSGGRSDPSGRQQARNPPRRAPGRPTPVKIRCRRRRSGRPTTGPQVRSREAGDGVRRTQTR